MNGLWGYMKGTSLLEMKALPRLLLSPAIGAVRGAIVTTWKAIEKHDADMAAFRERYFRELKEKRDRASSSTTAATH